MIEHRWINITGGAVSDPDFAKLRTQPTPGDGSPDSLAAGQVRMLPKATVAGTLVAYFEVYDGQGTGAQPVTPTPIVSATLEVVTVRKDAAGNATYSTGAQVVAPNQRRIIIDPIPNGLIFVRATNINGALPDPGSIRIFVEVT